MTTLRTANVRERVTEPGNIPGPHPPWAPMRLGREKLEPGTSRLVRTGIPEVPFGDTSCLRFLQPRSDEPLCVRVRGSLLTWEFVEYTRH